MTGLLRSSRESSEGGLARVLDWLQGHLYHLQVPRPRCAGDLAGPRPDIEDDGSIKPGQHEMSAFFIHLQCDHSMFSPID